MATCSIAFCSPWRQQSCSANAVVRSSTVRARPRIRLTSEFIQSTSALTWQAALPAAARVCWRRQMKRPQFLVSASLLGVGAPEVIVIAVVALLVFGPKGLAEIARSLGQSLRAFQPTIRELQSVSRDFKQTLEKEIGLDELSSKVGTPISNQQQQQQQQRAETPAEPTPVNENFVIEELTAQLQILQDEKAAKEAAAAAAAIEEAPKGEEPSEVASSKSEENVAPATKNIVGSPAAVNSVGGPTSSD